MAERPLPWIAVAAALAVLGGIALYVQRDSIVGRAGPDPCEGELALIADDGRRLPVVERRCEPRRGRHAALLVRSAERRSGLAWARALDRFAREGRAVWVLAGASPEDQAPADLRVAIEALAGEAWTDPGRVGVVLVGDRPAEAPGAAALVLHRTGDAEGPLSFESETPFLEIEERAARDAAPRAEAFLAAELGLPSR